MAYRILVLATHNTGKILERECVSMADTLTSFIPEVESRRFMFEIIKSLRKTVDTLRLSGKPFVVNKEVAGCIRRWILGELRSAYLEAHHFTIVNEKNVNPGLDALELALRDRHLRLCGWAVSAMVITDNKGIFAWRISDMDIFELQMRQDLIEVLESMPQDKIGILILPLLKIIDWELLSKNGKVSFHYAKKDLMDGVSYFLQSENRFIVLSMLYHIECDKAMYRGNAFLRESLDMLKKNNDDRIASAAGKILEYGRSETEKNSRAFELLERVLFFKKCFLFHNISAEKLLRVVELSHSVSYGKNDIVVAAGDVLDQIYIVRKGGLRIETDGKIVGSIKSGDTFGEAGLFSKKSTVSNAIAEEATVLYLLKRADIKRLIREVPDIALNFLESITTMLSSKK